MSMPVRFAKAQKLATSLSSALSSESQAYGKIVDGLIALKRKDANEAIRQITAANNLLDTWIGRFDLGRAYLEAGAFTEADSEFDQCMKRRGEAIELFMDNVPTYAYFPPVYYYQGRVREGMKSEGFATFIRPISASAGSRRKIRWFPTSGVVWAIIAARDRRLGINTGDPSGSR